MLLAPADAAALPMLAVGHQLLEEFCKRKFWHFMITFHLPSLMIGLFIQEFVLTFESATVITKHRNYISLCASCQSRCNLRLYCGWNLHIFSHLIYLKVLISITLENKKFHLYFFLWKKKNPTKTQKWRKKSKKKKWGLNIFHWFVFCVCSHLLMLRHFHVALWQMQVYNSCWFFCLLEKGFCLWKIWPYLFMDIFDNSMYFFSPLVSITSWLAKGTLCWHYIGQKTSCSFNWQGYFPIPSLDYWDMQLTLCSFFVSAKRWECFVEREKCAFFTYCLFYIWSVLEWGCSTSLHSFNEEDVRFYLTEHY